MNSKHVRTLAAGLLAGAAIFTAGGSAFAAPVSNDTTAATGQSQTSAGSMTPHDVVYRTETRKVSSVDNGAYNGNWKHCLYLSASPVVSHPTCSEDQSIALSFSPSGAFSAAVMTSTMGFNVTYSNSWGSGVTFDVPAGKSGYADVGDHYESYTVGMQSRTCQVSTGSCGGWSSTTYLSVQKFLANTYAFHQG